MRRLRQWLLLILVLTGSLYFVSSRAVFRAAPSSEVSVANGWEQAFADDFEVESNWSLFEEIVGGNPCYGKGVGSITRSNADAYRGDYSLLVWANETQAVVV